MELRLCVGQQLITFALASCRTRANRTGLPYAFCGAILCEVDTSMFSIVVPVDGPSFEYPQVPKSLNRELDGTPKVRQSAWDGYVAASFFIRLSWHEVRALRAAAGLGTQSGQWSISKGRTTRCDNGASADELNTLVGITDPALWSQVPW